MRTIPAPLFTHPPVYEFHSCFKLQKKLANYPKIFSISARGGGFAGMEFTYALLESGDIYQKKCQNKFTLSPGLALMTLNKYLRIMSF